MSHDDISEPVAPKTLISKARVTVTVNLPLDVATWIDEQCEKTGRNRSVLLRRIIKDAMKLEQMKSGKEGD